MLSATRAGMPSAGIMHTSTPKPPQMRKKDLGRRVMVGPIDNLSHARPMNPVAILIDAAKE
jgi:hypothetical protein